MACGIVVGVSVQRRAAAHLWNDKKRFAEVDVGSALERGLEAIDLDLLQVAAAARARSEAEIGEIEAGEILGNITAQRRGVQPIEGVAEGLVGCVPCDGDLVPLAVLDVAEVELSGEPGRAQW